MRFKTTVSARAKLVDHNGAAISAEQMLKKLDGLVCHTDSVLNYAELSFADACGLRGGHPRLQLDGKHLAMAVEVDSQRKLSRKELGELRGDLEGQLSDGIGAGCFDELSAKTGLTVELQFPLKARVAQAEGIAWLPRATTASGNERRIAAVARLVEAEDRKPPASSKSSTASKKSASSKKAAAGKSDGKLAESKPSESKPSAKKPNLKKLFRLLDKVERDQLFAQIKSELEACGNDLSMVADGELPYGNFRDPKLLRLLLTAGLPPETIDVAGNSLLIQAAAN
ncbi:MAG: hypothetical protein KDB14_26965, partial [Planctomycetales bacterium]|nr:hypothetical protein [Planctomycetales bacterium]